MSTGQNDPPLPRASRSATAPERRVSQTLMVFRLGATLFGVLAGVACYIALDQFTAIGTMPAFVIGLVFALLTRTAAASLARDWLIRSASRASDRHGEDTPSPPANR